MIGMIRMDEGERMKGALLCARNAALSRAGAEQGEAFT
jgi:hypothetical protein